MLNSNKTYLFIDESGDPAFYASGNKIIVGSEGFKPLLLIGVVELEDKKTIRKAILQFMDELINDEIVQKFALYYHPKRLVSSCKL